MNVIRLWWLSLGIFAAVVAVVAALLGAIAAVAKSIDRHAEAIWTAGKQIAGNTVSIWMLAETNERLSALGGTARSIERTAAAIDEKLRAVSDATGRRA